MPNELSYKAVLIMERAMYLSKTLPHPVGGPLLTVVPLAWFADLNPSVRLDLRRPLPTERKHQ